MTVDALALDRAADAVRAGGLVVYPTETVYGLGADALDPEAVERVFETKGRSRDDPLSLAVASVADADEHVRLSDRERAFAERFLPGPVTVVCEKRDHVPDVLTADRDRAGLRVPDHDVARSLLERVAPLTATSANLSGTGSARTVDEVSPEVRDAAGAVLDGGETPGGESTVVDVARGVVHREGRLADDVRAWLAD